MLPYYHNSGVWVIVVCNLMRARVTCMYSSFCKKAKQHPMQQALIIGFLLQLYNSVGRVVRSFVISRSYYIAQSKIIISWEGRV